MIRFPMDVVARPSSRISGAVPGLIPSGLTVLFGETGARKTFTSVGIAVRVAAGLPFGPYPTSHGLVVIIAAEDVGGVEDRVAVAVHGLGLPDTLPVGVMAPPCRADQPRFADAVIASVRMVAEVRELPVALVVLDTLAASVDGLSLNDDSTAGAVAGAMHRIARELKCSALVLHHPGKGDPRRERGSQVIRDRADAAIRLEARGAASVATVEKMRNGRAGSVVTVDFEPASRLIAGETVETLIVSRICEAAESGTHQGDRRDIRLSKDMSLVLEIIRAAGPGPHHDGDIRASAYVAFGERSTAAKKKAFQRSIRALADSGLIEAGHGTVRDTSGHVPLMSPPSKAATDRGTGDRDIPPPLGGVSRLVPSVPMLKLPDAL
ncbi:AAA family ATPase [Ancylobacter polymorphus]|uniref:AAA family ATPase n=1 Tax=Ancylobacter polymorphus TaxID=223390 RepID=A0ABU0B7C5_9HYPH|nr:AAA family ATPase [Ancylobacter polymorphus]MDQ0301285.1 hypothetical protein [Ancylobacter polymorphus]